MIFQLTTYEVTFIVLGLLIGLSVHEWAHAWAALLLGDPTPKEQGRLSLNPLVHIDILGFLAILLIGFGWAKPVQIDPRNFKHPRRSEVLVALAGPISNLLLASVLMAVTMRGWYPYDLYFGERSFPVLPAVLLIIRFNVILFIFNMIPIPPLDGSHLISALFPQHMEQSKLSFQRYGQLALLAILLLSAVFSYRFLPIYAMTKQVVHFLMRILTPVA